MPRGAAFFRAGHPAAIAAAVAIAYYVGAIAGLQLRLPHATPSVLWPPNAILTAVLLFVPPARWWSVLLGAAVAHFATELLVWPLPLVTALFLTNCSEALLAAGLVRYLSDDPSRFDSLRRVAIFIVAAGLVAPFVSSFLDAGVVRLILGEDYWTVWRIRFPANVLAQLSVVPTVAGLLHCDSTIRSWPRQHWLDSLLIGTGLVIVTGAVLVDFGGIGLPRAPLALFLPILLWGAVRFGPSAVGLTVLATVLLTVESETQGYGGLLRGALPEDRIQTLQIFFTSASVAMLGAAALVAERQKAVAALQVSDLLKSTILDSIPSSVVVLDREGRVVALNESWLRSERDSGMPRFSSIPGAPYLQTWAIWADERAAGAREVHQAITRVLEGLAPSVTLEYPWAAAGGDRWWLMSVVPLKGPSGGAVVTQSDITARKRLEIDMQQSRDELAHVSRVWVMGELTAALSHQLNQPLAGIMGNAQAGLRFLAMQPPNMSELNGILEDITADAARAASVTRAVRDMLRRDTSGRELLDLNEVVRDTATLVASQCSMHRVSLRLALAPSLPSVPGERVQLRQVVLNLMMNAIESVTADRGSTPRVVAVRTDAHAADGVRVTVVDSGEGLTDGTDRQVFEPLYTTKTGGMGMGLPIARAIVEAHGGAMSASNAPDGGAVFQFTLPVSPETYSAAGEPATL